MKYVLWRFRRGRQGKLEAFLFGVFGVEVFPEAKKIGQQLQWNIKDLSQLTEIEAPAAEFAAKIFNLVHPNRQPGGRKGSEKREDTFVPPETSTKDAPRRR